jgi:hypothetical protein
MGAGLDAQRDPVSGKWFSVHEGGNCDRTFQRLREDLAGQIEQVTFKGVICRGLRPDGVYSHSGCWLTAITKIANRTEIQMLSISGPTVNMVNETYTLFRQGVLDPEENWESPDAEDSGKVTRHDEFQKCITEIRALVSELREFLSLHRAKLMGL